MIELRNLSKVYGTGGQRKIVADRLNILFPSRRAVAILGRNGVGKSTLLKMISGSVDPTSGQILTDGEISFPIGFAGSFHGDLTGAQNTRFVARIYGVDCDELIAFVADFAELGAHFHMPFRSYSSGMKSRLAFGISMGLRFDTYLIDEITAVGDARFRQKSRDLFHERLRDAGALFVSHSIGQVREICDAGAVLEAGHLTYFADVEDAIERHLFNMKQP